MVLIDGTNWSYDERIGLDWIRLGWNGMGKAEGRKCHVRCGKKELSFEM